MATLAEQLNDLSKNLVGDSGIAAINITSGESVEVNARTVFATASMIKTMVLFELYRQAAAGTVQLSQRIELKDADRTRGSGLLVDMDAGAMLTLRDLAIMMMTISDNTATNMLIDFLGVEKINAACAAAGMKDTNLRGKLDFAKVNVSQENFAVSTPWDFAHFFAQLSQQKLLPVDHTAGMLKIMRIQKYMENMRRHLPFSPYAEEFGEKQTVTVASKSGGFKGLRCESGLVTAGTATWSLSVMTRNLPDTSWTSEHSGGRFVSAVSKAVFDAWAKL